MDSALASATANVAAVTAQDGVRVAFRIGSGRYSRITLSTVMWAETGDTLAGQPVYDRPVPYFPPHPARSYGVAFDASTTSTGWGSDTAYAVGNSLGALVS